MSNFRYNLRVLRLKRKMSQMDLAIQLDVSKATIYSYEAGRSTPNPDMLIRIGRFFNCTIDQLIK